MIVYKLSHLDGTAKHGNLVCKVGAKLEVTGKLELCVNGIHCYAHPIIAVIHDRIDGGYGNDGKLWKCSTGCEYLNNGTKICSRHLSVLEEVLLPVISMEQKVEIAIQIAMYVYKDKDFHKWAEAWISNKDRSANAAYAAANAAYAAANAAANAAYAAAYAADAAYAAASAAAKKFTNYYIRIIKKGLSQ